MEPELAARRSLETVLELDDDRVFQNFFLKLPRLSASRPGFFFVFFFNR